MPSKGSQKPQNHQSAAASVVAKSTAGIVFYFAHRNRSSLRTTHPRINMLVSNLIDRGSTSCREGYTERPQQKGRSPYRNR